MVFFHFIFLQAKFRGEKHKQFWMAEGGAKIF